MRFNGVDLRELSPEQWNGRTRSMVVWNTTGEQPGVGEVYGVFFEDNKPVWSVRILGKELKAEHVAEIPTLEVNYPPPKGGELLVLPSTPSLA
jgi:hypothetical protein